MKFSYTRFQARKYREEAGSDGDAGAAGNVTSADTGDDDADAGGAGSDNKTVLTGADDSTDEDSNEGDDSSSDDKAGKEGSDEVPETYADFTLPEGMELDETALAEATPMFKELGLNQEQSQKAVDLYAKLVQAGSQKQVDDFNQLVKDWGTQAQNDKEYGGDNFDKNIKVAQSAIAKYGTPELKQLLDDYGVGNHPEVIRFMVRVGQTLGEDVPGAGGTGASESKDRVEMLYGKQEN